VEQFSANRYVTMVIYQKLLPRTKKRGVFYLSLKISSLNRLASYDDYPPAVCVCIHYDMCFCSMCSCLRPSPVTCHFLSLLVSLHFLCSPVSHCVSSVCIYTLCFF